MGSPRNHGEQYCLSLQICRQPSLIHALLFPTEALLSSEVATWLSPEPLSRTFSLAASFFQCRIRSPWVGG